MPEDESQTPPVIPSFASLRAPGRRAGMDWLDPEPPSAPAVAAPLPPRAPRPAEWPDLLRLGVRVARSLACLPGRVALWSLRHLGGDDTRPHPLTARGRSDTTRSPH
jgi:hypothetical protein